MITYIYRQYIEIILTITEKVHCRISIVENHRSFWTIEQVMTITSNQSVCYALCYQLFYFVIWNSLIIPKQNDVRQR